MPKLSKKNSLPSKFSTFYILYSLQRSWKSDQIYSIFKYIIWKKENFGHTYWRSPDFKNVVLSIRILKLNTK